MTGPSSGRAGGNGSSARVAARASFREFSLEELPAPRIDARAHAVAASLPVVVGAALALLLHARGALVAGVALGLVALVVGAIRVARDRQRIRTIAALNAKLVIDGGQDGAGDSLSLVDGDRRATLLRIDQPFGATLLATPGRDALILALTHRDGVEFVGGLNPTGTTHVGVLARATTTPRDDLPLGPATPTFAVGDRLLDLVRALEDLAPGALDRVFLSDAGMADVVVDAARLRAGQIDFDLRLPLQWHSYAFQEGSAFAANSFQATHVRQGEREVVLVSLAPTGELGPSWPPSPPAVLGDVAAAPLERAVARDLRLARSLAEPPPRGAHRIAVDRLFMPRLRAALDQAPREERSTPTAQVRPSAPTLAASEHILASTEGRGTALRTSRP